MATLVTGGAGFVGANIVKDLALNGHEIICFDLNLPDRLMRDFIQTGTGEVSSRVTFVSGDIVAMA